MFLKVYLLGHDNVLSVNSNLQDFQKKNENKLTFGQIPSFLVKDCIHCLAVLNRPFSVWKDSEIHLHKFGIKWETIDQ